MSVGRYWILTIPHNEYTPYLPRELSYVRGQLELGANGFLHWQLVAAWPKNVRLSAVRKQFGPFHAELTKSDAALAYVWKEDTRIPNTQFELGELAFKRNSKRDWDQIWESAKSGNITAIDAATRVQHYKTLKQIKADHLAPAAIERTVHVFWGPTGTGKSRRAWDEAGITAYPKDPRTKFWDGYQGHVNVVMDEFRGAIDISHLLRWFDRYPVIVEVKGSSTVLMATTIWITSNLDPRDWFAGIDVATRDALLRRLTITHFNEPINQ